MAYRRKKEFNKKCVCAFGAVNTTGISLENFTEHGLQSVHSHIQQTLGNMPACPNYQCSLKRDIDRWCIRCTSWRIELVKWLPRGFYIRKNRWKDMKSWCWPNGARDIAEVFILPNWPTSDINLQDISTIFSVWNRCSYFSRNVVNVLEPLKECRNELIHKTRRMYLTNERKKVIFQNISDVINHPDIRPWIPNHADVTKRVRGLERGRLFQADTNRLQKHTVVWAAFAAVIMLVILCLSLKIFKVSTELNNFQQTEYLPGQLESLNNLASTEDCISEKNDKELGGISLFEYIYQHLTFIGREWLFKQYRLELQSRDVNNRGILLEARTRYGTSAVTTTATTGVVTWTTTTVFTGTVTNTTSAVNTTRTTDIVTTTPVTSSTVTINSTTTGAVNNTTTSISVSLTSATTCAVNNTTTSSTVSHTSATTGAVNKTTTSISVSHTSATTDAVNNTTTSISVSLTWATTGAVNITKATTGVFTNTLATTCAVNNSKVITRTVTITSATTDAIDNTTATTGVFTNTLATTGTATTTTTTTGVFTDTSATTDAVTTTKTTHGVVTTTTVSACAVISVV